MRNDVSLFVVGAVVAVCGMPHFVPAQECQWTALGSGTSGGYPPVRAMAVYDDGAGPTLYVGGAFTTAGDARTNGIARWDGGAWSDLDGGMGGGSVFWPLVAALAVFDDGTGAALYAGGDFSRAGAVDALNVARWDGAAWSEVGQFDREVWDLVVFDDGSGPALFAAGGFETAGGSPAGGVAKWDGERWHPLGEGLGGPTPAGRQAASLVVFDDGGGPALYAAGRFTTAGGQPAGRIAKWDGAEWSPLGVGISGESPYVLDLAVFDDGSGAALYAGGFFTWAGGAPANRIARWDGSAWSAVGAGVSDATTGTPSVGALAVFDDGTGDALYAAGNFETAGGKPASYLAKWNGVGWSAVAGGLGGVGASLGVLDIGGGPALYVGGDFDQVGAIEVNHIVRLDCQSACYADCDGDGELAFFDFLCFQNLFAAADPHADCDGSGGLDFFDFLCFQNAFAAGCE